jgi:hypothetical protein
MTRRYIEDCIADGDPDARRFRAAGATEYAERQIV